MEPAQLRAARAEGQENGEFGIDWQWAVELAVLMRKCPVPSTLDVMSALARLNSISAPADRVDLSKLESVLSDKRAEWERTRSMHALGIPEAAVDQILMVHANTLQNPMVYAAIGAALRNPSRIPSGSGASEKVQAVVPYVKALDIGVAALPSTFCPSGNTYRGVRYAFDNLEQYFFVGRHLYWYEPRSVTTNRDLMYDPNFCGCEGPRTIFVLEGDVGRQIKSVSAFEHEAEVLTRPLTKFRVLKVERQWDKDAPDGDPWDTADIVHLQAVRPDIPSCSLADMLAKAANDALKEMQIEETRLVPPSQMVYDGGYLARIVFVGPTKAGKSTLVNAFFQCEMAPSGKFPETILPTLFHRSAAESTHSVALSGEGLADFLRAGPDAISESRWEGLTAEDAAGKLRWLNAATRRAIEAGTPGECCDWCVIFQVPGESVGAAIVDCPGGSEGGKCGYVIQKVLAYQISKAAGVAYVVSASNVVEIQTDQGVAQHFGGEVPARPAVLVVNHIATEEERGRMTDWLRKPEVHEALGRLALDSHTPFYINAKAMFCSALLAGLPGGKIPSKGSPSFKIWTKQIRLIVKLWYPEEDFDDACEDQPVDRLHTIVSRALNKDFLDTTKVMQQLHTMAVQWPMILVQQDLQGLSKKVQRALDKSEQRLQALQLSQAEAYMLWATCLELMAELEGGQDAWEPLREILQEGADAIASDLARKEGELGEIMKREASKLQEDQKGMLAHLFHIHSAFRDSFLDEVRCLAGQKMQSAFVQYVTMGTKGVGNSGLWGNSGAQTMHPIFACVSDWEAEGFAEAYCGWCSSEATESIKRRSGPAVTAAAAWLTRRIPGARADLSLGAPSIAITPTIPRENDAHCYGVTMAGGLASLSTIVTRQRIATRDCQIFRNGVTKTLKSLTMQVSVEAKTQFQDEVKEAVLGWLRDQVETCQQRPQMEADKEELRSDVRRHRDALDQLGKLLEQATVSEEEAVPKIGEEAAKPKAEGEEAVDTPVSKPASEKRMSLVDSIVSEEEAVPKIGDEAAKPKVEGEEAVDAPVRMSLEDFLSEM